MQRIVTGINKHIIEDDGEQQLAFFLDFFVVNLKFMEAYKRDLFVSHKWKMQMTMGP
jgi:hypothetical protein